MSAINAVLCDLDGTLVRTGNVVLPEDVEMLRAVRDRGIRTTLITGRPSRCLSDMPAELWPLFTTVFTSNGASSFTGGQLEIVAPLEATRALNFATMLRKADPTVAFAVEFDSTFGYEPGYAWWPATDADPTAMCAGLDKLLLVLTPVTKMLCQSDQLNAAELAQAAKAVDRNITITYSCRPGESGPVEVMSPHASKGRTTQRELLGAQINPRTAAAFGDRHNDVSMLLAVGRGIAIGEAVDPDLVAFDSARSVGQWLMENQELWAGRSESSK